MANPFNQNDPDEIRAYKKMIISCVAAASLVVLLFLVVLYENSKDKRNIVKEESTELGYDNAQDDFVYGESNLTSQDLDFWNMYDDEEIQNEETEGETVKYKKSDDNEDLDKTDKTNESKKKKEDEESDNNSEDEKDKLEFIDKNGESVWYEILSNVNKHEYDLKNSLNLGEKDRLYYQKDNKKGYTGIDISKENVVEDFAKVKNDGIDFIMLRVGFRGYSSGGLQLDDNFVQNISAVNANNIYAGVYFESQAINEQEAIEEANFSVGAVGNSNIRYPIAISFVSDSGEAARSEKLSMKERTKIAKAFCDTVKQYGYNPVIKASRDDLISKFNLEDLNDYDIWISDYAYPTDYPYDFSMLEYTADGTVDGIVGNIPMNISFVKYDEK